MSKEQQIARRAARQASLAWYKAGQTGSEKDLATAEALENKAHAARVSMRRERATSKRGL